MKRSIRYRLDRMLHATVLIASSLGCFMLASTANAEESTLRRPVMSPYLDLLRDDGGVLPNYHQFVRPKVQLLNTLGRQNRAIRRGERDIRSLGARVNLIERQGGVRPTGIRGTFMDYGHFYPGLR